MTSTAVISNKIITTVIHKKRHQPTKNKAVTAMADERRNNTAKIIMEIIPRKTVYPGTPYNKVFPGISYTPCL
ncbi:hypothetical protein KQI22_03425 [Kineothrix sp. MSJ-39]|uniref:hypothetical protein n=1 Tax=Kineothrix sp. MSJ-39 TaxID=2841533 RepID=UPI001C0FD05E|nr:hypothetical protein [Kineothrix sp. MSJ-39]MBU5429118.1 hypothetical protein [Kineothrix sp. MSJ-39]